VEPHVPHREGRPVMAPVVYPALYHGPVNYFARLVRETGILLEQHDHYTKQTYRNRCRILGPNGPIDLSIPVRRKRGGKTLLRDVRVDLNDPWNKIHWKSLVAAYASSPYFEIVAAELEQVYENPPGYLVDLNTDLLQIVLHILGLDIPVERSIEFKEISGPGDPRDFIHPKRPLSEADPSFRAIPYHQVFSDRFGFQPNLSILDLVFNQGPESVSILHGSLRT